jgi:galactokinase
VITEGARVSAGAAALLAHDWAALGSLFSMSHESLRDDFEVSCAELDSLVAALAAEPGCYGARMTGAGFGGSVVALVDPTQMREVAAGASAAYRARFHVDPSWFVARSLGGVRRIHG